MPLKESEAVVLRTYPLREADLLVTLFTRTEGKVRGVARAAKKSQRRFGGALEPLTYVRAFYEDHERQELSRLDALEVLESPLADGLTCVNDKRLASSEISSESRMLAARMFRAPVESFTGEAWPKARAADLRKFLVQILQRHIEKKIVTAGMLVKGSF